MSKYIEYQNQSDTNPAPSPSLWGRVDESPKGAWAEYWNDFTGEFDPTTACGWTITQEASGALALVPNSSTIYGHGILSFDSAGNNAAHDGINAQLGNAAGGEDWCPRPGKTLIFEARIAVNDESDEFFMGLCDTETDIIEQTTGMLDATGRNMIGFYTDAGTTATYLEFVSAKAGSADQDTDVGDGATIADNTWIKVGFIVETVNGAYVVTPFINGKELTSHAVTDQDDIPVTLGTGDMRISGVAQIAATGADAEMYVDWIRVAQLR